VLLNLNTFYYYSIRPLLTRSLVMLQHFSSGCKRSENKLLRRKQSKALWLVCEPRTLIKLLHFVCPFSLIILFGACLGFKEGNRQRSGSFWKDPVIIRFPSFGLGALTAWATFSFRSFLGPNPKAPNITIMALLEHDTVISCRPKKEPSHKILWTYPKTVVSNSFGRGIFLHERNFFFGQSFALMVKESEHS
jgi:hypothetical protein